MTTLLLKSCACFKNSATFISFNNITPSAKRIHSTVNQNNHFLISTLSILYEMVHHIQVMQLALVFDIKMMRNINHACHCDIPEFYNYLNLIFYHYSILMLVQQFSTLYIVYQGSESNATEIDDGCNVA